MKGTEKEIFVAKTFKGLEEVLGRELLRIDADNVEVLRRAVRFEGDKKLMYRANFELRTALRILKNIDQFKVETVEDLYNGIKNIPWNKYMNIYKTFFIDAFSASDLFNNSEFLAMKSKDAIADFFMEQTKKRPSVKKENPDLIINVHIANNLCTVSLDSSGEPLFKRGYRIATGEAPINEVLAAGMIYLSGWKSQTHFIDPMCGSGTLPIEAAMQAYQIPAQIKREEFGFFKWRNFDKQLWEEVKRYSISRILTKGDRNIRIIGSDISENMIKIAQQNIKNAGLGKFIELEKSSFSNFKTPEGNKIIIMNPPYNERLKKLNINEFYSQIGNKLKASFINSKAWIITSNNLALKNIGLAPSKKITLNNGALESKFACFEIYLGSKKQKYQIKDGKK